VTTTILFLFLAATTILFIFSSADSPSEKVEILNLNNGNRFETYTILGKAGSGQICLNGPAARLGVAGDKIIILSYAMMDPEEAKFFKTKVVYLNEKNKIKK